MVFFLVLPPVQSFSATPPPPTSLLPSLPPFTPFTARVAETANVNRPELGSNACV